MGMPPSASRFSTRMAFWPRSPINLAASRPAGPPPIIRVVSDAISSPDSATRQALAAHSAGVNVFPGEKLFLAALKLLEVFLKLRPGFLVIDAHFLQQRAILGRVPMKLAHPVGVGAHCQ